MDIELIKKKFISNESKPYNKNFMKKLVLRRCMLQTIDRYSFDNLLRAMTDKQLTDEQREKITDSVKATYKEERKRFEEFLKDLFDKEKSSTVVADESDIDAAENKNEGEDE